MVRQVRTDSPSSYPSPPGGNLGGLALHIWDMFTPDIEMSDNDIISPTGTYETETSGDECNRVTKVYFVRRGLLNMNNQIKTLISTFVWRNPECVLMPSKPETPQIEPLNFPDKPTECVFPCCIVYREYDERYEEHDSNYGLCKRLMVWKRQLINIEYPLQVNGNPAVRLTFKASLEITQNIPFLQYHGGNVSESLEAQTHKFYEEICELYVHYNSPQLLYPYLGHPLSGRPYGELWAELPYPQPQLHVSVLVAFDYDWVEQWKERGINYAYNSSIKVKNEFYERLNRESYYRKIEIWKSIVTCGNWNPTIPPPLDECCKNMSCCPNNNNIEQLLRLILKRIGTPKEIIIFDEDLDREGSQQAKKTPQTLFESNKLTTDRVEIANRIIGIANFPVTVPETLVDPHHEDGFDELYGFIPKDKEKKLKTLTEFLAWKVQADSALIGHFHQVIEYEEKEGEEKEVIVLPNISETLKELIVINAQAAKQINIITEAIYRVLTEIAQTKTQVCRNVAITEDIQDYLDYPTVTKSQDIDVAINVPGMVKRKNLGNGIGVLEGIDGFADYGDNQEAKEEEKEDAIKYLQNGTSRFVYEDWNGKNSLHDQLVDLLQMASILRAIMYQRVDKD
ncbi:hypothetical protein [Scytonema sp. NUACC26]|uniref:hypothetical protein n=1 Tax=Scytonema sp. NUACC26 TaxID=3140176 RepID=UPI0034DC4372